MGRELTQDEVARYRRDGYVVRQAMFDPAEVALVQRMIETDPVIAAHVFAQKDAAGGSTELALWNHPGDDVFGAVARSARIVDSMTALVGEEVYHWHSKLTLKRPARGGAWEWHQDYGYWYGHGCLAPKLASVFIAIDASTRENGCLQVIRGSHELGRIDHGKIGTQSGADPERVDAALRLLDHVHVEMQPGDALFFHSNLLHCSGPNLSPRSRNILLCCYNAASNSPFKAESPHPHYTKLVRLPDEEVLAAGGEVRVAEEAFLRG